MKHFIYVNNYNMANVWNFDKLYLWKLAHTKGSVYS
jgi:hypothetical protein